MNKFRTHNCSELSEKEIGKNVYLRLASQKKRSRQSVIYRFERSLRNDAMRN